MVASLRYLPLYEGSRGYCGSASGEEPTVVSTPVEIADSLHFTVEHRGATWRAPKYRRLPTPR